MKSFFLVTILLLVFTKESEATHSEFIFHYTYSPTSVYGIIKSDSNAVNLKQSDVQIPKFSFFNLIIKQYYIGSVASWGAASATIIAAYVFTLDVNSYKWQSSAIPIVSSFISYSLTRSYFINKYGTPSVFKIDFIKTFGSYTIFTLASLRIFGHNSFKKLLFADALGVLVASSIQRSLLVPETIESLGVTIAPTMLQTPDLGLHSGFSLRLNF